jgi:hypothetical protein
MDQGVNVARDQRRQLATLNEPVFSAISTAINKRQSAAQLPRTNEKTFY